MEGLSQSLATWQSAHFKYNNPKSQHTGGNVDHPRTSRWKRLASALGWTRSSYFVMSAFLATIIVIGVVWWPLLKAEMAYFDWSRPLWEQLDWLLLGDFLAMSLLIMVNPDLKSDVLIVLIALGGGLAIEGWGTQTELWTYYTAERPPLWIIPAWPVANLSVNRLVQLLDRRVPKWDAEIFIALYWAIFPAFYALMLAFTWPTLDKSLTVLALVACGLMIATPTDHRRAVLTFVAGTGLGYFLELWGTTRYCWTYYTRQQPPLFTVLAHGLAAIAFWRVGLLFKQLGGRALTPIAQKLKTGNLPLLLRQRWPFVQLSQLDQDFPQQ